MLSEQVQGSTINMKGQVVLFLKTTTVRFTKLSVVIAITTAILGLIGQMILIKPADLVRDWNNINFWFLCIPMTISLPYYLLFRKKISGFRRIRVWIWTANRDRKNRKYWWELFRRFALIPLILVLLFKISMMLVSETSIPIWNHYGPIYDSKMEYYQPIWAEHMNNGYVWLQSHLTFLPTLESLQ